MDDDEFCSKCDYGTCIGCCMRPFSHQRTPYVYFSNYDDLSDGAKNVLDYLDNILVYTSTGEGQNELKFIRNNLNQLLEFVQEPIPIDLKLPTLEEQQRLVKEIEESGANLAEALDIKILNFYLH